MRGGAGAIELLFALTILGLLALPLIDAGRANGAAAEQKMAQLLRRQAADALMSRLIARPLAELRRLRGPAPPWITVDAPGTDALRVTFEEDVEHHAGLCRITLDLTAATGRTPPLKLVRLVRKEM